MTIPCVSLSQIQDPGTKYLACSSFKENYALYFNF